MLSKNKLGSQTIHKIELIYIFGIKIALSTANNPARSAQVAHLLKANVEKRRDLD